MKENQLINIDRSNRSIRYHCPRLNRKFVINRRLIISTRSFSATPTRKFDISNVDQWLELHRRVVKDVRKFMFGLKSAEELYSEREVIRGRTDLSFKEYSEAMQHYVPFFSVSNKENYANVILGYYEAKKLYRAKMIEIDNSDKGDTEKFNIKESILFLINRNREQYHSNMNSAYLKAIESLPAEKREGAKVIQEDSWKKIQKAFLEEKNWDTAYKEWAAEESSSECSDTDSDSGSDLGSNLDTKKSKSKADNEDKNLSSTENVNTDPNPAESSRPISDKLSEKPNEKPSEKPNEKPSENSSEYVKGSLIDDFANVMLEQPSYMDPED